MGHHEVRGTTRRSCAASSARSSRRADRVGRRLLTPDFVGHTWGPSGAGPDGLKAAMARMADALADARFVIDDEIAEGDRVVVRVTASARQVGEFMGAPASGKSYEIGEIHIFRLRGGRIAEHWHQFDRIGMLQQLGAMPAPQRESA